MNKLNRHFYCRDTQIVAKELLGKYLVHEINGIKRIGLIVEVEAYLGPHDLASHSAKGITKRNSAMFGQPGFAYVYLIYGMYFCVNVVTEEQGQGCAVLIRALQPIQNLEGRTQGPGLLCQAMSINLSLNGHDLLSDKFYIAENPNQKKVVVIKKARIGINYAKHWAKRLLRFYIKGNAFVSKA